MPASSHTGEYAIVLEWFENNRNMYYSPRQIAAEFQITARKANNILGYLTRTNRVSKVKNETERSSVYRYRHPTEKREEFKVAKVAKTIEHKGAIIQYPVFEETTPSAMSNAAKRIINARYSTAAQKDQIHYVNPSTFVVYNSSTQRRIAKEMTLIASRN